jgi:FtsH-binding integral membrane protein
MIEYNSKSSFASSASRTATFDSALRDYMVKVYQHMSVALIISGLVAFLISSSPQLMQAIFGTPLAYVVMFAPLIFVIFFGFKLNSISAQKARSYLYFYAGLMGLSLATIFVVYTGASITRVFLITASTFGAMSLYGYSTKKDLTSFGSFLIMGLIGIMIASLVNIFLKSSGLEFAISFIGVFIFIGLTAYDTQRIKQTYYHFAGNDEMVNKMAVLGALNLYMDFINLFIMLLRFFGERKE